MSSSSQSRAAQIGTLTYPDYLRLMPKAELHCHLTGAVRPATFAELASKHGVDLPADAHTLYRLVDTPPPADPGMYAHVPELRDVPAWSPRGEHSYPTLRILDWISASVRDASDFERVVYECLQDALASNVVYREVFFNPSIHQRFGASYSAIFEGLIAGVRAAETDFGIVGRLIPSIDREDSAEVAVDLVREALALQAPEIVGIGMDCYEIPGPPERFVEAYALAREAGLHRTAHAAEHLPAATNVVTCLDVLQCERIDHGYFVLLDDAVVERCRQEAVPFTCIFTTTRRPWVGWRKSSFQKMAAHGLRLTINSDDPAIFGSDIGQEYATAGLELGYGPARMREFCLNAIDIAWLEDSERQRLRERMVRDLDDLDARLV